MMCCKQKHVISAAECRLDMMSFHLRQPFAWTRPSSFCCELRNSCCALDLLKKTSAESLEQIVLTFFQSSCLKNSLGGNMQRPRVSAHSSCSANKVLQCAPAMLKYRFKVHTWQHVSRLLVLCAKILNFKLFYPPVFSLSDKLISISSGFISSSRLTFSIHQNLSPVTTPRRHGEGWHVDLAMTKEKKTFIGGGSMWNFLFSLWTTRKV